MATLGWTLAVDRLVDAPALGDVKSADLPCRWNSMTRLAPTPLPAPVTWDRDMPLTEVGPNLQSSRWSCDFYRLRSRAAPAPARAPRSPLWDHGAATCDYLIFKVAYRKKPWIVLLTHEVTESRWRRLGRQGWVAWSSAPQLADAWTPSAGRGVYQQEVEVMAGPLIGILSAVPFRTRS